MGARKAFIVRVELDVQAVTCPGVWLCSNGQVSLQLYMLDSCVQTTCLRPFFPMLFHEQFNFSKTLPTKYHLEDLSKQLSREWLYVELIQWDDCQSGNVLAYFQIPLNEFLYPTVHGGIPNGTEVDLLMETTPAFPGALAPKLEVSNKTTIEETICSCNRQKFLAGTVQNSKRLLVSDNLSRGHRAVCHCCPNKSYRNKKGKSSWPTRCRGYDRPPWRYKKVEDGFLQRKPVFHLPPKPTPQLELDGGVDGGPYGGSRRTQPDGGLEIRKVLKESLKKALGQSSTSPRTLEDRMCSCGAGHLEAACPLCQKYLGLFSSKLAQRDQPKQVFSSTANPGKSLYNQLMRQAKQNYVTDAEISDELNKLGKNRIICQAHTGQPNVFGTTYNVPKESLTSKIHDRVSRTLQNIPKYVDDVKDMCKGVGDCQPASQQCTCSKLPRMGQFYRDLYEQEHGERYN